MRIWERVLQSALLAIALAASGAAASAASAGSPPDMNAYVRRAIDEVASKRQGHGYDVQAAFTQDLRYGPGDCPNCIKSLNKPATMCVAGVSEIIVEALNLYFKDHPGTAAFQDLPLSSWTQGSISSIRSHIFMYKEVRSRGTGYALQRFGVGVEKTFDKLEPYDFVNFDRENGSKHAAVFIAYLDRQGHPTPAFDPAVAGFRYYSAQGKGKPDAGFGYRDAFFAGACPPAQVEKPRDCGIVKALTNHVLIDGGTLLAPETWTTGPAADAIRSQVRGYVAQQNPGRSKDALDTLAAAELQRDLTPDNAGFTGETLD